MALMTMNHNLYSVLSAGFPADKTKPALSPAEGKGWSYGALDEFAGRVAAYLVSLGCQPGDRLAAQTEKSFEAIALYLGCLRAGVAYLPLNTAYTRAEIEYFLKDAEPRVFVCRPSDEEKLQGTAMQAGAAHLLTLGEKSEGSFWQGVAATKAPQPTVSRGPDDLAAICYTSGTTGRSKGAMLTHRNLSSNAETLAALWGFKGGDVVLHALPVFHVHGLFVALHTALISGSEILFLPKFDVRQVIGLLPRASVMMGVPTFYTRLLGEKDFTAELTKHMRLFVSGSAPLLAETHKDFSQRTGKAILERYGMTETGMLASNPLDGARRAGTVGKALPGIEIRIADDQGRALPQGEVGVVEVKGPNIFPGYWRRPEQRAEDFRADGFFITGDVGLIEPDGYLTLVGRAKDLIITGGYNVYPKEVELLLDALPGVTESAVIGLPHPDFGEAVTAVVTGTAPPLETEIITRCKQELASYKVPKRVIHLPELPRNAMGKVQKALLREAYKGLYV